MARKSKKNLTQPPVVSTPNPTAKATTTNESSPTTAPGFSANAAKASPQKPVVSPASTTSKISSIPSVLSLAVPGRNVEVGSVECRVESAECGVESAEVVEVGSVECRVESVEAPVVSPTPMKPATVPVSFVLFDPHAGQVTLSGEFNEWSPDKVKLKRQPDGHWQVTLNLIPGRYEYKYIVDGQWMPDPLSKEQSLNQHGTFNSIVTVRD